MRRVSASLVRRLNQSSIFLKRHLSQDTDKNLPSTIVRHGVGDGIIILDVGGKEFKTLRSTIASNKVLSEIVQRAESNSDLTNKGAIFVDRDPAHFGLILQYLRNKTEGISYKKGGKMIPNSVTMELPKNNKVLRDIYFEAMYYGIEEIQSSVCGQSFIAWFFSLFSKSNPFDTASKLFARMRATLAATIGLIGVSNINAIIDTFPDGVKEIVVPQTTAFIESSTISEKDGNERGK